VLVETFPALKQTAVGKTIARIVRQKFRAIARTKRGKNDLLPNGHIAVSISQEFGRLNVFVPVGPGFAISFFKVPDNSGLKVSGGFPLGHSHFEQDFSQLCFSNQGTEMM
jgi:hypothetical protein